MIRRDFLLRSIQQMAQALARVLHLKDRQEYQQALAEIGRALRDFSEPEPGGPPARTVEDWLALCRKHPEAPGELMLVVADLLIQQDELLAADGRAPTAEAARPLALGLLLAALLEEECPVTAPLIAKVEGLVTDCGRGAVPSGVLRLLVGYFEARGRFASAEDALYDWLESGDAGAAAGGRLFYERLAGLNDAALGDGGFSREEISQGMRDWQAAILARA